MPVIDLPTPQAADYIARLFQDPQRASAASASTEAALIFLEEVRWPAGPVCPRCESTDIPEIEGSQFPLKRRRRCRSCRAQFSPTSGTPLNSEEAPPEELVLCVALATQYQGIELVNQIHDATALSAQASTRLALLLQDFYERSRPTEPEPQVAQASDPELRVPPEACEPEVHEQPESLPVAPPAPHVEPVVTLAHKRDSAKRPFLLAIGGAGMLCATLIFIAWATGSFERVLTHRWRHDGRTRVVETTRKPGELLGGWHERHDNAVIRLKEAYPPNQAAAPQSR